METRKGGEFLPGPFPGGRAATQVRPYASIAAYSSPRRGGTKPAPYRGRSRRVAGCAWGVASASQIPKRNLAGGKAIGIGLYAPRRGDEGRHAGASCPTGGCGEPPRLPWPAAHSGASAARSRRMGGNRSGDYPQRGHQPRAIPQSRLRRDSSLCTREPLGRGMRIAASLRFSQ